MANIISHPLSLTINQSFQEDISRMTLKNAIVTPFYKTKDKKLMSNYRPVSVLTTIVRLYSYLTEHYILYEYQYGFWTMHSTDLALITAVNSIYTVWESRQICLTILTDQSKAFDKLDHEILVNKSNCYGVQGPALNWRNSYLTGRTQKSIIGSTTSQSLNIMWSTTGLSTRSFIIYINDITKAAPQDNLMLHTDDCTCSISDESLNNAINRTNIIIKDLSEWFVNNYL